MTLREIHLDPEFTPRNAAAASFSTPTQSQAGTTLTERGDPDTPVCS